MNNYESLKMSLKCVWHHLEFMLTILLKFDVHTRNWPSIDLQRLEFNSKLYFWRFRGGGGRFAKFQKRVRIVGLYIKLKNCSRSQKIIQNNYFD